MWPDVQHVHVTLSKIIVDTQTERYVIRADILRGTRDFARFVKETQPHIELVRDLGC